jgi:ribosomal protein S19
MSRSARKPKLVYTNSFVVQYMAYRWFDLKHPLSSSFDENKKLQRMEPFILPRNMSFLDSFVRGITIRAHNGLNFRKIKLLFGRMSGFKIGQFVWTRKLSDKLHTKKDKKKLNKSKK